MENLQPVKVRGERWRVANVRAYESCRLVTLVNATATRRVLAPFDDVVPIAGSDRPRLVSARRWRHACRAALASDAPPGSLRAAARAQIDLLPHQLEPALAVLRGLGSRLLLADDVGLGKTIQAGLIVAELLARGCVERVLVLTPAGVRDQWIDELRARFAIDATLADARTLRQHASTLPIGVNPWIALPIAVASLDYVKRPEVLPALLTVRWDVVIVDEAHAAAGDSDRRAAVQAVARNAAYVLLLSATPHNGDEAAFAALCDLGHLGQVGQEGREGRVGQDGRAGQERSVGDPLLVFRRSRQAIRGATLRAIHTLHVRPSESERRMYAALARYQRAVRSEHGDRALALSALDKRAFSSAWSLAASVDRRLATLTSTPSDGAGQLALPLDDADGELTLEDAPPLWPADLALADARHERLLLEVLSSAAREAVRRYESKLRALRRLLRRARESAIVFTEYRDTALHLHRTIDRASLVLHGGMDRAARAQAVDEFCRRGNLVLIATDAAGQGLNLHHSCRLVINLELPWNPMRLEQRIGRVDRIGQRHRVHAVHLVAAGTGETGMLSRLHQRLRSARASIDVPDPLGLAAAPRTDGECSVRASRDCGAAGPVNLFSLDLSADASSEAARVAVVRSLRHDRDPRDAVGAESVRPLILRARRRRLRLALGGRPLLIYLAAWSDADGRTVESRIAAISAARSSRPRREPITPLPATELPKSIIDAWHHTLLRAAHAFWSRRCARERAIVAHSSATRDELFQPALFDRRAERQLAASSAERGDLIEIARARLAQVERMAVVRAPSVTCLLAILP